ncbi:MAG: aminopeptidase P family protein [Deltaproteobacteria bacterium]|nr:aminopeptidase P family protein [Deltaproteobacteria bacterium]
MKKKIENRISKLRKGIFEKGIDGLIVLVEENRRYLSGYTGEDTQFDESAGALLITQKDLVLATDSRFEIQAGEEAPLFEIVCYKKGLEKELPSLLRRLDIRRPGFESIRLSYMKHALILDALKKDNLDIDLVPVHNIVENLRLIKDEDEIMTMKKSLSIAEAAFKKVSAIIMPGMSEHETAWLMEKKLHEHGADALAFPVICASGPNSAMPHAIPGKRKFSKGEPVLFDWGARLNGYCSDISRTILIGKPDKTYIKVYNTVLKAQQEAISAIKPGMNAKDVDAVARGHIKDMGFGDRFGHGLGHGVGLAVHEPPKVSPLADTILEPNMVFTVEPGIYIPGWGGVRIENMVVVREDGAEVLNSLSASI